ncbi:MAG: AMP-binding protein [Chloroflexi bacterium]|nr:AMP-binding protein [Chloroflexota bacterium]
MDIFDVASETMLPDERSKYYDENVKWVVEYAYENASAIRDKMISVGISPSDIKGVNDLEKIPVTKKDDLPVLQSQYPPFGGLLGVPRENISSVFISPGPIYDPFGEEVYIRQEKGLYAMGFRAGDLVLNTFSYHLVPAGLLTHQALSNLGVIVIPSGVGNTDLQLQILHDLDITGFIGTPSFLMTLIEKAEKSGYDFRSDFAVQTALLGAEMLPQTIRNKLVNVYGIRVSESYATADLGIIAYECPCSCGMHIPEELLIEITDPVTGRPLPPGETGEVVITTFEKTRPLVRFGTGDLSMLNEEPCQCERTSPRLVRIVGRVGESVKVRGMMVHPKELSNALQRYSQIAAYQAVVNREGHRDDLTLRIELESDNIDREKLSEDILQAVSTACRVKFDKVEWVGKGTIPEDRKIILDERTWE